MAIETRPPEGSNFTQEQWETVVDRTDHLINKSVRDRGPLSALTDPAFCNGDVYRLVDDGKGGTELKPLFAEGETPDKYEQTRRLVEAAQNKERLFYRPCRAAEPWELSFAGDPPEPSARFLVPPQPFAPQDPGKEYVPANTPEEPEKLPEPSWYGLKSFLNDLFGWFEEELAPYRENLEEIEGFPAKLEEYNADEAKNRRKWEEEKAKYPQRKSVYDEKKAVYDEALKAKETLNPAFQPYKDKWEQSKKAEDAVKTSYERVNTNMFFNRVFINREIERRFSENLGAKASIKPEVKKHIEKMLGDEGYEVAGSKGVAPETPEYSVPGVAENDWIAMTLAAITQPGIMKGLKDSSSGWGFKETDPEHVKEEVTRYNGHCKVLANIIAVRDPRVDLLHFGVQRARALSNEAWREFAEGKPEKAAKMFGEGLTYNIRSLRGEGTPESNETKASYHAIKLMLKCAEDHPELAKYIDKDIMTEARGGMQVYDELERSLEAKAKLLTDPPKDAEAREALLLDAMTGFALTGAVKAQKLEIKNKNSALSEASKGTAGYPVIRATLDLPQEELTVLLGDPKNVPGVKAGIAENLKETEYFKELLEMPPEKLSEELNNMPEAMEKSRAAVVEQRKKVLGQQGSTTETTRESVRTTEVKQEVKQEAKPKPAPVPNAN